MPLSLVDNVLHTFFGVGGYLNADAAWSEMLGMSSACGGASGAAPHVTDYSSPWGVMFTCPRTGSRLGDETPTVLHYEGTGVSEATQPYHGFVW